MIRKRQWSMLILIVPLCVLPVRSQVQDMIVQTFSSTSRALVWVTNTLAFRAQPVRRAMTKHAPQLRPGQPTDVWNYSKLSTAVRVTSRRLRSLGPIKRGISEPVRPIATKRGASENDTTVSPQALSSSRLLDNLIKQPESQESDDDLNWEKKYIGAKLKNWLYAGGSIVVVLLTCCNIWTFCCFLTSLCVGEKDVDPCIKEGKPEVILGDDGCSVTRSDSPDVDYRYPTSNP